MSNPFRTPEDYELFLYTLAEQFPSAHSSTVVFIRRGATLARVSGELFFERDISQDVTNFHGVVLHNQLYRNS